MAALFFAFQALALVGWRLARGRPWTTAERAALVALLVAGGGLVLPFLTPNGTGSGEAYNYSLALADAVQQVRAGQLPLFAGQTEFAFNGRIHPLRNAPYLGYFAAALDAATLRQLSFFQLQNLSLALSLQALVWVTWGMLRWSARCPPLPSAALSLLLAASPVVLATAYSFDLYMTVHAAPFAMAALGAATRELRHPSAVHDVVLAASLAAAWWAHPPIALWVTAMAGGLRLAATLRRRPLASLGRLLLAALAGLALAGFVFVSVWELSIGERLTSADAKQRVHLADLILHELRLAFPGSLLPVSARANETTDLQLGYPLLMLLALSVAAAWRLRRRGVGPRTRVTLLAAGAALLLLTLCLPVPGLTHALWAALPRAVHELTNVWPMQRLYLIAGMLVVLAAGWSRSWRVVGRKPAVALWLLLAGLTVWQAYPFFHRSLSLQWSAERTHQAHLPANLDLTITSYAFLGLPATFTHGVLEPWAEFRVLGEFGRTVVADNFTHVETAGREVARGELSGAAADGAEAPAAAAELTLEPGRRYLLLLEWTEAPPPLTVSVGGASLQRHYFPSRPEGARAFGFGPERRRGFALSTAQATPEVVQLQVRGEAGASQLPLTRYRLLEAVEASLPVQLESLLPLQARVIAPEDHCYLETPRRFTPGYTALVNHRAVRVVRSPEGNVMVPLARGENRVELRSDGSGRFRAAFWGSTAGWIILAGGLLVGRARRHRRRGASGLLLLGVVLGTTAAAAVVVARLQPPRQQADAGAGPLLLRLLLPIDQPHRTQVILSSGQPAAGNLIYLAYLDDNYVQVVVDVWGKAVTSEPVRVDFQQPLEMTINAGFLYPKSDPAVQALPPTTARTLARQVRIELNGQPAIDLDWETFPSTWADVHIGSSVIGGSSGEPEFGGTILGSQRLPIPRSFELRQHEQGLSVRWPTDRVGHEEPLLSLRSRARSALFSVRYVAPGRVLLRYQTADGAEQTSAELAAPPRQPAELVWRLEDEDLIWLLDGQVALTLPGWAADERQPRRGVAGYHADGVGAVDAYFTGEWAAAAPAPLADTGPLRLVLRFPPDRLGRSEPLVVTGEAGRADIVYVTYVDADHVQFGLDHWGVGSVTSEAIPCDYSEDHEVIIDMPSLYPSARDPTRGVEPEASATGAAVGTVTVRLDDRIVWQTERPIYPVDAAQVAVGRNDIGASSCEPAFLGEMIHVERLGEPAPSAP